MCFCLSVNPLHGNSLNDMQCYFYLAERFHNSLEKSHKSNDTHEGSQGDAMIKILNQEMEDWVQVHCLLFKLSIVGGIHLEISTWNTM